MKQDIVNSMQNILTAMGVTHVEPNIEMSDIPEHGCYTTSVAMKLTKILKKPPMTIAREMKQMLENNGQIKKLHIKKIDVVPPGFMNFFLSDEILIHNVTRSALNVKSLQRSSPDKPNATQTIMVEFAHPNTHKAFHIGHLRNIITGECIVRLLEANGNTVIRANYQGDVGLHIAKCLFGIMKIPNYELRISKTHTIKEKIALLSGAYVAGNTAYEENAEAKNQINELNGQIYDKDPSIYPLYEKTRAWSLEYFDKIYQRVGSRFDRLYFESETYVLGKTLVMEYVDKGVFEKSDGAVIFPGKKYGLHNRVFVTSEGNPTYEGKDIGLAKLQFDEYHPDRIIHCVSSEQIEYFRVIFEAIAKVFPQIKGKEHHLVYGWVRLKEGKMSSRTGNVILGEWLLDEVKKSMKDIITKGERGYAEPEKEYIAEKATVAAVKYAFLKVSTPQEIAFDIKESVNINGDSGPYLLYTYARCKSVMEKSGQSLVVRRQSTDTKKIHTLNQEEHDLARLLLYFPEIIESAANNFTPNLLCVYLFNLAQTFNLLYANHQILGNTLRLLLTQKTAETLKAGLNILGIETIERM